MGSVCLVLAAFPPPAAGQWESVGGPGGCSVGDLIVVGNTLLAATDLGIYRSADDGASWVQANPDSSASWNEWGGTLFACGHKVFKLSYTGLLVSLDLGTSWTAVPGAGLPQGFRAAALLENDGILFLGLDEGAVYFSGDQGENWAPCGPGLPKGGGIAGLAAIDDGLFAGEEWGTVFRSNDRGTNWTEVKKGLPEDFSLRGLIASDGRLLAYDIDTGIFVWQEREASWKLLEPSWSRGREIPWLDACGPYMIAEFEEASQISGDGGRTWAGLTLGLPERTEVNCIAANGPRLFIGTGLGVFRSDDLGATWTPVNAGFPSQADVRDLAWVGDDLFAALGEWGRAETSELTPGISRYSATGAVFKRTSGAGWQPSGLKLPTSTDLGYLEAIGMRLIAGAETGIYVSDDGGRDWLSAWPEELDFPRVNHLAVIGDRVFAATDEGLYRSSNQGLSWSKIFPGESDETEIGCIAEAGRALFIGGARGVFVSKDGGETWARVEGGYPPGVECVSLAASGKNLVAGIPRQEAPLEPADEDEIVIPDYPTYAILASKDGGRSWSAGGRGLPEKFRVGLLAAYGSVFIAAIENHYLKAGRHSLGLYISTDGGESWTDKWPGQWLATAINCLREKDGYLYAGMLEGGIWRLPVSTLRKR